MGLFIRDIEARYPQEDAWRSGQPARLRSPGGIPMESKNSGKLVKGNKLFKFAALMSFLILGAFIIDIGLFIAAASAVAAITSVFAGIAGVIDTVVGGFLENIWRVVFSSIYFIAPVFPILIFMIACGDVPWGELAWLLAALVGLFLSGSIP